MYSIYGYDKDDDVYELIGYEYDNLDMAIMAAKSIARDSPYDTTMVSRLIGLKLFTKTAELDSMYCHAFERRKQMRVYEKHSSQDFDYPDEMKRILDYLNIHGTVLVKPLTIEKLYYEFSEDIYCASWMCINDDLLEEFSNWLDEYDI